ncbi:MAG TPA: HAD-IA family hydrolase [Armatimonadota bacterium]|nr:HAD-IA family hydrolase [Armatimonadota bacterium]
MTFRAVIFDLYWTLLYEEETGLNAKAEEVAAKVGVTAEAWHKAWHGTLQASWLGQVSLLGRVRAALEEAGAAEYDGALAEELAGLMAARSTPRLYADVRESLARVKEMGFKMGLISNISSYRAAWLKEIELDRYFDAMALSCELGVTKPERAIYLAAVEGLGVKPEECVFVDDVPPYVQAARKLGMATVRINRFGSDEIYREYYDDLDFEADLRIEGLGELVEWLDGRSGA